MAEHFLEGRLAAFVEHTEKTLTDIPKDEDKLPLLINLAAAHYELGLYRKSIKSCEAALILDQNALQAYKIWGKALVGLGRKSEAVNIWETALKCIDSKGYDILLAKDIYELVKQNSDPASQESDLENELTALKLEGKVGDEAVSTVDSVETGSNTSRESNVNESEGQRESKARHVVSFSDSNAPNKAPQASQPSSQTPASAPTTDSIPSPAQSAQPSIPTKSPSISFTSPSSTTQPTSITITTNGEDPERTRQLMSTLFTSALSSHPSPPLEEALEDVIDSIHTNPTDNSVTISFKPPSEPPKPTQELSASVLGKMKEYYRQMKQTGDHLLMRATLISAMKTNLPHLTHIVEVDNCVAVGYLEINANHYDRAREVLNFVLKYCQSAVSAFIGRGSIYAMERKFHEAVGDFTKALGVEKGIGEAWKRRGQTYAAMGRVEEGIADLSTAIRLSPTDYEVYYQRGMVYYQLRNYVKCRRDLKKVMEYMGGSDGAGAGGGGGGGKEGREGREGEGAGMGGIEEGVYSMLGQVSMLLGEYREGIEFCQRSVEKRGGGERAGERAGERGGERGGEKRHREVYSHIGRGYRELGEGERAIEFYRKSIGEGEGKGGEGREEYSVGLREIGSIYYEMGYIEKSIEYSKRGINILLALRERAKREGESRSTGREKREKSLGYSLHYLTTELLAVLYRAALSYHSLGVFPKALFFYEQMRRADSSPSSPSTPLLCIDSLLGYWEYVDTPIYTYHMESLLPRPFSLLDVKDTERYGKGERGARRRGEGCRLEEDGVEDGREYREVLEYIRREETLPPSTPPSPPPASLNPTLLSLFSSIPHLSSLQRYIDTSLFLSTTLPPSTTSLFTPQFTPLSSALLPLSSTPLSLSLPSRRLQRLFSLSILQVVGSLRRHLSLLSLETSGLMVREEASSAYHAHNHNSYLLLNAQDNNNKSNAQNNNNSTVGAHGNNNSSSSHAQSNNSSSSSGGGKRGKRGGGEGGVGRDSPLSSSAPLVGTGSRVRRGVHRLGWRDVFDIVVRWLQVGNPQERIFYLDLLPPSSSPSSLSSLSSLSPSSSSSSSSVLSPLTDHPLPLLLPFHCGELQPPSTLPYSLPAFDMLLSTLLSLQAYCPLKKGEGERAGERGGERGEKGQKPLSLKQLERIARLRERVEKRIGERGGGGGGGGEGGKVESREGRRERERGLVEYLGELRSTVGEDFYVNLPYVSLLYSFEWVWGEWRERRRAEGKSGEGVIRESERGLLFEGSRLTVSFSSPEGCDFSLRPPSSPERYAPYYAQLDYAFEKVEDTLLKYRIFHAEETENSRKDTAVEGIFHATKTENENENQGKEAERAEGIFHATKTETSLPETGKRGEGAGEKEESLSWREVSEEAAEVLLAGLCLFYSWTLSSPLSTGTSFAGLAVLQGVLLAHGEAYLDKLTFSLHLQALFSPSFPIFLSFVLPRLRLRRLGERERALGEVEGALERDELAGGESTALRGLSTMREMMHALALPYSPEK